MTYKELAEQIAKMPEERQLDLVTVALNGTEECIPASSFQAIETGNWADGILDEGHWVLEIDY